MGLGEVPPRVWPQVLKAILTHPGYRKQFFTTKRREMKMFWKYDSHAYIEKFTCVAVGLFVIFFVVSRRTTSLVMRLPTEDVNELLKQDAWIDERNAISERKDQASKMLMDSNYIQQRNAPIK